jgi:hypothetical protein
MSKLHYQRAGTPSAQHMICAFTRPDSLELFNQIKELHVCMSFGGLLFATDRAKRVGLRVGLRVVLAKALSAVCFARIVHEAKHAISKQC